MALTPSSMLPLGTRIPSFNLIDVKNGKEITNDQVFATAGLVVMFICNHCPYVVHVQDELARIATEYLSKQIGFVAICSNDASHYPEDAPAKLREQARRHQFEFPYLYDETQETARQFQAACTPDFYVFNKEQLCYYRGRLDGSTPGNGLPVTGNDLRGALEDLIRGADPPKKQYPSVGCNIKWKS